MGGAGNWILPVHLLKRPFPGGKRLSQGRRMASWPWGFQFKVRPQTTVKAPTIWTDSPPKDPPFPVWRKFDSSVPLHDRGWRGRGVHISPNA